MADSKIPDDPETLLAQMREEGLPVVHTFFGTIHHRSEQRPDGYTNEQLDQIADDLHRQDVERWKRELKAGLRSKRD